MNIPDKNVAAFVKNLAEQHNIKYVRTHLDVWAEKITELSGDEVENDDIHDLILALKRANIITITQMSEMSIKYIKEKRNII